jgi:hypothetical protein
MSQPPAGSFLAILTVVILDDQSKKGLRNAAIRSYSGVKAKLRGRRGHKILTAEEAFASAANPARRQ